MSVICVEIIPHFCDATRKRCAPPSLEKSIDSPHNHGQREQCVCVCRGKAWPPGILGSSSVLRRSTNRVPEQRLKNDMRYAKLCNGISKRKRRAAIYSSEFFTQICQKNARYLSVVLICYPKLPKFVPFQLVCNTRRHDNDP